MFLRLRAQETLFCGNKMFLKLFRKFFSCSNAKQFPVRANGETLAKQSLHNNVSSFAGKSTVVLINNRLTSLSGASPYPGMNSQEVINFLQDCYRMDKPKHCSDEL